jgi:hypothetical protein
MKNSGAIALLAASLLLPAATSPPAPFIDQAQPVIDATVGSLALGGTNEQMVAQVFTAGITGDVTGVMVPIEPVSGALILELRDAPGGIPGSQLLSSETFSIANLPAADADGFRPLSLAVSVPCAAGSAYALVLKATDQAAGGGFTLRQGPVGDPYPRGGAFYDARPDPPGTWIAMGSRDDLPFKIVVVRQEPDCGGTCGLLGFETVLVVLLARTRRRMRGSSA